ncbi:MAG: hypothetical protein J7K75_00840, partial [Desulfuromonas sp.]|nr:hypothetical protein [Desulfuromonas sp.]
EIFIKRKEREFEVGYTLFGPHLDEYDFYISGNNCRFYSSQGQIRSILLSYKICQIIDYHNKYNEYPILLLDDIASELDQYKINSLFDYLQNNIGQVFITDTNKNSLKYKKIPDSCFYYVENGDVFPDNLKEQVNRTDG